MDLTDLAKDSVAGIDDNEAKKEEKEEKTKDLTKV